MNTKEIIDKYFSYRPIISQNDQDGFTELQILFWWSGDGYHRQVLAIYSITNDNMSVEVSTEEINKELIYSGCDADRAHSNLIQWLWRRIAAECPPGLI